VARFGGDEFAVLVEDRTPDGLEAEFVAQRMLDALDEPFWVAGQRSRITASIGLARYVEGDDADTVLMQADIAMYHAKGRGKSQFATFSSEMQEGVLHRLNVESWLREALINDQLRVCYQPIVTLTDRKVQAVEALVRWQHPTMGYLSPVDFLDVAEQTGLIVPLGKFVVRQACRAIARWRNELSPHLMVSINLSASQLRHAGLVEEFHEAMTEEGVQRGAIMVEVTEGSLIEDVEATSAVLGALWALGVTIAIDDFGTGFSSLSHLEHFPVEVIKVDKSFVDSVCIGEEESRLVRSVLAIGEEFGLQVVAEGIETEEQDAELRRMGCGYGQGFLYSAAVPEQRIDELLRPDLSAGDGEVRRAG
jgi:predicted signal transduction protein with EAL and GGDEF domain